MKAPVNLHVFGNIIWDNPSTNMHSISSLLTNAVTKNTNQIINSSVTFEGPVTIDSLYIDDENSLLLNKVRKIISDAVTDNPHNDPILIKGKKIFKKSLVVSDLEVTNNIDIKTINGYDFTKTASQIFQKNKNNTVESEITFLGNVEIGKLITNSKIHGVSLKDLATIDKRMPKNLHFKHLIIRNVTLYKLDGVVMDDFLKNRVTIHGDHEISGNVQFNSPVTVLSMNYNNNKIFAFILIINYFNDLILRWECCFTY
jgi:hypothetical protein